MAGEVVGSMGNLLDALPSLVVVSRKQDGRILYANRRAATHFGLENSADGDDCAATLFVRPTRQQDHPIARNKSGALNNCIATIVDLDGRQLLIAGHAAIFDDNGEELIAVTFQDSAVHEAAWQSERNAYQNDTVRRVSALLTHQLGNALIPVLTFADLAMMENAEGTVRRDYLQRIVAGAERCAMLVDELREFCRQKSSGKTSVELTEAARYAEAVLNSTLPKQVALDTDYDDLPLTVAADAQLLHDIIVGLGIAALDAIGTTPSLVMLSTARVDPPGEGPAAELRLDILDFPSGGRIAANANRVDLACVAVGTETPEIEMVRDVVRGVQGSLAVEHTGEGVCIRLRLPLEADVAAH